MVVLLGTMAILITKGTELWILPLAAQDLGAGSAQEPGQTLLSITSQSYAYSLTMYYDYLGLWLWSLFGLLVARPLFQLSTTSAKVAAVSLGGFGIIYPVFYGCLVTGVIPQDQMMDYSTFMLLAWIGAFAMGFYCRGESKTGA